MWETARHLSTTCRVTVVASEATALPLGVSWLPVTEEHAPAVLSPYRFRRSARRALDSIEADVVVSYGSECPPGDLLVVGSVHRAWLACAGSVTVGRWVLPGWARAASPGNLVRLAMERSYFRSHPRALAPVSEQVAVDLARYYGVPRGLSTVIHNGFDAEEFSLERRKALREEARGRLGLSPSDRALLMVANEWQRKGLGVLLDALALLHDPDIRLILVGRQPPTAFEEKIRSLNLEGALHYEGPTDDVGWYHAAADLFVLPTQYEAFALAVVEALASGLPVITTRVPGAGDLIQEGVNGLLLADPSDAAALSKLIANALADDRLSEWSRNAAVSVKGLDWSAIVGQLHSVLQALA